MTYYEMMNLNERQLRDQNVTSGATNKILSQIQKLKERNQRIVLILQTSDISDPDVLDAVLSELNDMSCTPMKPLDTTNGNCEKQNNHGENRNSESDEDAGSCCEINNNSDTDDDHLTDSFIMILERSKS